MIINSKSKKSKDLNYKGLCVFDHQLIKINLINT